MFLGMRGSLRAKIIAWSFVPTAIILAAVALVGFVSYQRVAQDLMIGNSRELARLAAAQLSGGLAEYDLLLTSLARTAGIANPNPSVQRPALRQAGNRLAIFDGGTLILNDYGIIVATEPEQLGLLGQDWSGYAFYRQMVRSPGTVYSQIVSATPEALRVIVVAVPITGEQGELIGTLAGMFRLDASSSSAFYGTIVKLRIGADDTAYLIDRSGAVLYHTDASLIGDNFSTLPVAQLVADGKAGALPTRDFAGRDIVASYAPVPNTTWGLVIEQNWASLLASGQTYGRFLLLLLGLGLVVPAIFVTIGVRRITEPIEQLIGAAQQVAGGKFGQEITVRTGDEVEELVKQFNLMSARLSESYSALKEREERFALITERANDGIWDWDLKTQKTYFSPRWKSMLGYADDEIENRYESWLALIHPDDRELAASQEQAHLSGQAPVYHLEHRLRHKDGSYRWILARGIALRDEAGQPYRMVGSHTDITERKQAEEAVRQSEKRFSQVFHASPLAISITSLSEGRYVDVNDAWLRLYGYTRQEVLGNSSLNLGLWVDPRQRAQMIEQLSATGSLRDYEHLARCKSGQVVDVLVSAEVIELNDQRLNLSLVRDITEQKTAKRALEAAYQTLEQRVMERTHELATLNAIASVVSRSLDLKEIMSDALDKTLQALDLELGIAYRTEAKSESATEPAAEPSAYLTAIAFRGAPADSFASLARLPLDGNLVSRAAEDARPTVSQPADWTDIRVRSLFESEGIRRVICVPLSVKRQIVGAILLATRDERSITPEEMSLLGAIGQQVGMAVENARLFDQAEQSAAIAERTRLARELHDSVTQSLYSVTLYAEAAARLLAAGAHDEAADHLRELRDTAQESLREMRLLIYELRPLALEKTGLAAALQARLDSVEVRGGLKAELTVEGTEQLPPGLQSELYHFAHEALNNVIKHAHARHVQVHIRFSEDETLVEVRDDGQGFSPTLARHGGGLGLRGMHERAAKIRGHLEIESAPGQGTCVRMTVPGPSA